MRVRVASELMPAAKEISTIPKAQENLRAFAFHSMYYSSADLAKVTCFLYNLEHKENKQNLLLYLKIKSN